MKKLAVFLVIGAIAAVAVVVANGGDSFGVTPASPMGDLQMMLETLREKGVDVSERNLREPECFSYELYERLREFKCYEFREYAFNETGVKHWVLIAVDEKGEIQAIGGSFWSGSNGFTTSGSFTQNFIAGLWRRILGREPEFEKRNAPGIDIDEYLITRLETGTLEGIWKKIPNSGIASHTRTIWDMVLIWRRQ